MLTAAPAHLPSDAIDVDDPLVLPDAWQPSARAPLPIASSLVPVVGAVALWLVTGSMLSLLLAALGPLIVVATILDGRRAGRRDRRTADVAAARARTEIGAVIDRRHDDERSRRWARHPDVVTALVRESDIWRAGRAAELVVGAGSAPSGLRVTGGAGDPEAASLRARAARLTDSPVTLAASEGIAVVGVGALAEGVHRALALQLCHTLPPGALRLLGPLAGELSWAEPLPHRRASEGLGLALVGRGGVVPQGAQAVLALVTPGDPIPSGCAAVLAVESPERARLDHRGSESIVAVEAIGRDQALMIVSDLTSRAEASLGMSTRPEEPVAFGMLAERAPARRHGALPALVGTAGGQDAVIDLVADGPHAVVAGVTGSGKSELLITWILALAATHSTGDVSFLLADFKGGTAFDALSGIPHVTGVITDLDGAGARRAIESLRAEVRWREGELAKAGARDVLDPRVDLPRLVIVVDEFAAMLTEHPELHAVFADVAARGRALGMHLILGTQRASGVIRDGLLANCPLRISLRVTDPADSRAVIGDDSAAASPGDAAGRGIALVRRGGDAAAHRTRIALTAAQDVATVVARTSGPPPRRPWLPELPSRLELSSLEPRAGTLIVGLADEPEHQRQSPVGIDAAGRGLLIVGGPGSGRSTALRTLASQADRVIEVPSDPEGAWDAVAALVEDPPARGATVVVDDLDALAAGFAPDYAHELTDRLERVFRRAGDTGVLIIASAQRLTGPAGRLADLLPRRLVLGTASKAEHLAAGGDPSHYAPTAPAGRGRLDGVAVQVAIARPGAPSRRASTPTWNPTAVLTGLVTRRSSALRATITDWEARGIRCLALDDYSADPSVIADAKVVVIGDPDEWQRHWRLLTSARGDHDLVIDTTCAAEFRVLTGSRALPPYAETGMGRAWLLHEGADAVRIILAPHGERSYRPDALP